MLLTEIGTFPPETRTILATAILSPDPESVKKVTNGYEHRNPQESSAWL
jgi:hypothetical protein